MIELSYEQRTETAKGALRRIRRSGKIPFVLYAKGKEVVLGSVAKSSIEKALREIRPGFLPTTVFSLQGDDNVLKKVLVREVQYAPTTYEMVHIDFMELDPSGMVSVKVPVDLLNSIDCIGVKMGGQLRQVMRYVRVRCPSNAIPSHVSVDVKEINLRESRRIKDIAFPKGVICLAGQNDVVVAVNK